MHKYNSSDVVIYMIFKTHTKTTQRNGKLRKSEQHRKH